MNPNTANEVATLAMSLKAAGTVLKAQSLASHLNAKGHLTSRGATYKANGRGIYATISACYEHFHVQGMTNISSAIAEQFVNEKGEHAWE